MCSLSLSLHWLETCLSSSRLLLEQQGEYIWSDLVRRLLYSHLIPSTSLTSSQPLFTFVHPHFDTSTQRPPSFTSLHGWQCLVLQCMFCLPFHKTMTLRRKRCVLRCCCVERKEGWLHYARLQIHWKWANWCRWRVGEVAQELKARVPLGEAVVLEHRLLTIQLTRKCWCRVSFKRTNDASC